MSSRWRSRGLSGGPNPQQCVCPRSQCAHKGRRTKDVARGAKCVLSVTWKSTEAMLCARGHFAPPRAWIWSARVAVPINCLPHTHPPHAHRTRVCPRPLPPERGMRKEQQRSRKKKKWRTQDAGRWTGGTTQLSMHNAHEFKPPFRGPLGNAFTAAFERSIQINVQKLWKISQCTAGRRAAFEIKIVLYLSHINFHWFCPLLPPLVLRTAYVSLGDSLSPWILNPESWKNANGSQQKPQGFCL